MAVPIILGGLSLAQGVAKLFGGGAQDKKLTGMVNALGTYEADGDVAGNLSLAKNLFNGRMAGGAAAEANILGNQSNTLATIERNATDPSQVLSLASSIGGSTNASLADLATKEAQDQAGRMGQLQNAIQMSNNEKAKVWADKLRKLNSLMSIKSTKYANQQDAFGDMGSGLGMTAVGLSEMNNGLGRWLAGKK